MLEICSGLSTRDEHRESWVESPEQISAIFTLPSPIKIDTGIWILPLSLFTVWSRLSLSIDTLRLRLVWVAREYFGSNYPPAHAFLSHWLVISARELPNMPLKQSTNVFPAPFPQCNSSDRKAIIKSLAFDACRHLSTCTSKPRRRSSQHINSCTYKLNLLYRRSERTDGFKLYDEAHLTKFFISEALKPKQFLKKLDCVQKNLHINGCTKE